MPLLLPRLPRQAAHRLYDVWVNSGQGGDYNFGIRRWPPEVRFTAVGGDRATPDQLSQIHNGVTSIAERCGYPNRRDELSRFDYETAVFLGENDVLRSGEALRDEVWSFFGLVLFPRVVKWRFGDSRERYLGGVRNTFQRLWMRAFALDRGEGANDRWGLIRELTEDALVQITERPSIGADPKLARNLAEAWCRAAENYGRNRMEDMMRLAVLRFRMKNVVRALAFLPEEELARVLDALFDEAADVLTRR
jgi:hypothetical protein